MVRSGTGARFVSILVVWLGVGAHLGAELIIMPSHRLERQLRRPLADCLHLSLYARPAGLNGQQWLDHFEQAQID